MPGDPRTDAALKTFADNIFKLSDLSDIDKTVAFALDSLMVQVLVSVDGKRDMRRICQDTKIPMDQLHESVVKLAEQGLIEPVLKAVPVLDKSFFNALSATLAHIVGPISSILIDEAISDLKLTPAHFPVHRVAELIGALSGEIEEKEKRLGFQRSLMKLLKERGYLEGERRV
ncbi:MAG: hypothetical protein DSY90_01495 [Deltaproteobacteria bacterium]|nr:MAG: hypothetical protein DSY90_01495 [Deltaproteobacteria bacterium]